MQKSQSQKRKILMKLSLEFVIYTKRPQTKSQYGNFSNYMSLRFSVKSSPKIAILAHLEALNLDIS